MKEETNQSGEELIDIDEKGNAIEKEEEDKRKKGSSNIFKWFPLIIIFILLLGLCFFFLIQKQNKKSVFEETTLKNLKLKNRVFCGAITYDFQKIETLVQNDVALVVTGGAAVGDFAPSPLVKEEPFRIDSDEYIEDLKKFPEMVHKYNSYVLLDLVYMGLLGTKEPIYSPSGGKGFLLKDVESKAMTKEDILRIQDYFVQAAIRAKKAGFDGVEIHSGHLTLVSSFFSKIFNTRTDEYGGSDENRARFLVEIIKKIREAIGDDMIISAKIDSVDEEKGFTESGFLTAGKCLEEAGVDLIEVTGANPLRNGDIYFYNDTKKLAETLKIPVTCIGGVRTYEHADYILKNSKIEYVALSRTLMTEPDLIRKWHQNK